MIPLPGWLAGETLEAWEEYCAQRVKDKKAMTRRSMIGRLKRLQELKDAGHSPLQCLDEALNGHWLDFYVPKEKPIEAAAGRAVDETRALLAEWDRRNEESKRSVIPTDLLKLVKKA